MTTEQHYDAIVVGTGPGGSTVARQLALQGMKVVMLEWGKAPPVKGTLTQMLSMGAVPGKSLRLTHEFMPVIRGITLGGSSTLCYATAYDPPAALFQRYGIDLSKELAEARSELPIAPLKDKLVGPMARRIFSSAKALGYPWQKLDKIIDQSLCRSACWRCSYGCPYGAKWSAGQFAREAVSAGAELVTGARVRRVLTKNRRAVGVEYTQSGTQHRVSGDKVVLSAGGLGSPDILRNSGITDVGQTLFVDPVVAVMGAVDNLDIHPGERAGHEIPMAAGMSCHQEGYMLADMTLPPALFRAFAAQAGRPDQWLSQSKTLTMMVKARDSLAGRIDHRGKLEKPVTENDKKILQTGYKHAHAILAQAGARSVYKSRYFAAHPGGTVKINQFVDSSLQSDIRHLYVCDASVIPEDWGLPPVLTLVCLGKRLAKSLF